MVAGLRRRHPHDGDRDDRTRNRLGSGEHLDHGNAVRGRKALHRQRSENVHHRRGGNGRSRPHRVSDGAVRPENRRAGLSILCVPTDSPGFSVGRNLKKIGLRQQDTAELFYNAVKVPVENLLGAEGVAFDYLTHNLPQERMSIALNAAAHAEAAIRHATAYVQDRKVFGKQVAAFQNTKFVLAECSAETRAARVYVDHSLDLLDRGGELSVADAARTKLFCTEVAARVIDKCLQLHGGYGYMTEYPIARLYEDTRVSRIYGGTSEVMKSIISKDLGGL